MNQALFVIKHKKWQELMFYVRCFSHVGNVSDPTHKQTQLHKWMNLRVMTAPVSREHDVVLVELLSAKVLSGPSIVVTVDRLLSANCGTQSTTAFRPAKAQPVNYCNTSFSYWNRYIFLFLTMYFNDRSHTVPNIGLIVACPGNRGNKQIGIMRTKKQKKTWTQEVAYCNGKA